MANTSHKRFTRMELIEGLARVRKRVLDVQDEAISGHGPLLEKLNARVIEGRAIYDGTHESWDEWGEDRFLDAMEEEVLDAVIYCAQRARVRAASRAEKRSAGGGAL